VPVGGGGRTEDDRGGGRVVEDQAGDDDREAAGAEGGVVGEVDVAGGADDEVAALGVDATERQGAGGVLEEAQGRAAGEVAGEVEATGR